MKSMLLLLSCAFLVSCSALDTQGRCDFRTAPSPYLVDNSGSYINLNGERVTTPVANPYYAQYQRCLGKTP